MIDRFSRIRIEFGNKAFAKLVLLLAGLAAMSAMGFIFFSSPWPLIVSVAGLLLAWLCKNVIIDHAEELYWAVPGGLLVYGLVLFVGDRLLGLSREIQLVIITATTVFMFGIQFWPLSDPSFVNPENDEN